jgi:hypothetical protein
VYRSSQVERPTRSTPHELLGSLRTKSQPVRWAVLGAASAGTVGAVVGLIVGLYVFAPTALFAMVELGLPAGILGGVVGFLIGSVLAAGRRISRNRPRVQRAREAERSGT